MPKGDIILGNALYFCGFKVVFAYFQVNKIIIIQNKPARHSFALPGAFLAHIFSEEGAS